MLKIGLMAAAGLSAIFAGYWAFNTYTNPLPCGFVLSCAPDKQFHFMKDGDELSPTTMFVRNSSLGVERGESKKVNPDTYHSVHFFKTWLEYRDNGLPWDEGQKRLILSEIEQLKKRGRPVLVIMYVHGWHHNADDSHPVPEDGLSRHDAVRFDYFMARQVSQLKRLYEQRGAREVPTVLGIYVGWRGASITTPLLRYLTVANRAAAANKLADWRTENSLFATVKAIAGAVKGHVDNKMLMVGHSFGARIISRMLIPDMENGIRRPFGDHTYALGISPAIGANCFNKLFENKRDPHDKSTPGLILVTSDNDTAVSSIYEWGSRILGTPDCRHKGTSHTSIGHPDHRTHKLTFEILDTIKTTDEGLEVLKKEPGASFPRLFRDHAWHSYAEPRTLLYIEYKTGPKDKTGRGSLCLRPNVKDCYKDPDDAVRYRMSFELGTSFNKSGHVWVFQTDNNTIGYQNETVSDWDKNHNGIFSTNLARLAIEWMYEHQPTPPLP